MFIYDLCRNNSYINECIIIKNLQHFNPQNIYTMSLYHGIYNMVLILIETPSSVQAPEVTSGLLKLRKSLPCLREGEEVMARWSDEGWYFRGKGSKSVYHTCIYRFSCVSQNWLMQFFVIFKASYKKLYSIQFLRFQYFAIWNTLRNKRKLDHLENYRTYHIFQLIHGYCEAHLMSSCELICD